MARLLLGVSGGVAAYKALETARLAVKRGHAVRVIQTPASVKFVGPASFQALTGAPVLVDQFESDPDRGSYPGEPPGERTPISHLALVERADLYLIAPTSANTIAKLAGGHADNLLTTAALAAPCPVVVAPAMNDRMYAHPATQANLELLRARGVIVIPPTEGRLASHGEHGLGRLAEPEDLLARCEELLAGSGGGAQPEAAAEPTWAGLRVLVTAGGTREPIDPVRFISNYSSGKMGHAIAVAAAERGAEVVLVTTARHPEHRGVRVVSVETAAEMLEALRSELPGSSILLMAAAVADFRAAQPSGEKIRREQRDSLELRLEKNVDILASLAKEPGAEGVYRVGFAAEGAELERKAQEKLERKGLDAIVANDISRKDIAFGSDFNAATVLFRDGTRVELDRMPKRELADRLLDLVKGRLS